MCSYVTNIKSYSLPTVGKWEIESQEWNGGRGQTTGGFEGIESGDGTQGQSQSEWTNEWMNDGWYMSQYNSNNCNATRMDCVCMDDDTHICDFVCTDQTIGRSIGQFYSSPTITTTTTTKRWREGEQSFIHFYSF